MRLRLLGRPRLETADGVSDLPLDRPASLGYHLVQRGDWVRRAELAYLYSPDADESAALANLRKLVHRLRHQGWAESLEAEAARLRLCLDTDVLAFRSALERRDWPAALDHYGGPFLEGLSFDDLAGYEAWVELEREDLARAWRHALLEHVRGLEAQAAWAEAEGWLHRLLRAQPLDEDAVQALMRTLHATGKTVQAKEVFERFRRALDDEMGVAPLESTQALADRLRVPELARPAAPPAAPAVEGARARHNLPAAGTRFVGRKHELDALARELGKPGCRLLTVVGLGGMGKTRLALELAAQQTEAYADGVWLVALAEITRPELLVSSVASALGLVFSGAADPKLQLVNYLRGKAVLLVLDNFEHLLDGALLLEELLSEAPQLKLLITSRVALETPSEWPFDLDGLPFPAADDDEELESFDAVRLFISRAERFSNHFALTAATLRDIAELTRRVEGMPLALELAATWLRGLSVADVLVQIGQGFELLQTDGRGVPERQRNLLAILEFSWRLLSEAEQAVLARLAVFRGGFALEAAQRVAGAHLGLLLRFINQALVRRADDGRYDLHELVRHFAEQRLPAADKAEVLARFSDHFHAQLLALGSAVRTAIQPDTVAACRRELGNMLSALDHLAAVGQTERLERALISFYSIVEISGLFKVGIARIDLIAATLQRQAGSDERLRGGLDAVKAYCFVKIGEDEEAARFAEAAIGRLERHGASDFLGIAHGAVGICHHLGGRLEAAQSCYGQALAVFERSGNRSEQSRVLNRLATVLHYLDRHEDSSRLYRQALEIATAIGDLSEQANVLNNYGTHFESIGQVDEAIRMYQASLEIAERIQFMRVKSAALTNLGHVHERRLEYAPARRYYERSLDIKRVLGEPVAIAISMTNLADVLYALGDDAAGHRLNAQAMAQTLSANALLYTARALWSYCKFLRSKALREAALLLACFLSKTVECEQWVRDEADQMIEGESAAVGTAALRRLRDEAGRLDHAAVAAWLERQDGLVPDLAPGAP